MCCASSSWIQNKGFKADANHAAGVTDSKHERDGGNKGAPWGKGREESTYLAQ